MSDREPRARQPSASAAAPGEDPQPASRFDAAPRVLPEETAPTRYVLSGRGVDRATFASALARLVVAREPASSETVENPDGSYGGASGIYPALDPDGARWTLTETTVVDGAAVTTTYELAPAP